MSQGPESRAEQPVPPDQGSSISPEIERGRERFGYPWRSFLAAMGTTVIGTAIGVGIGSAISVYSGLPREMYIVPSLVIAAGATIGFGIGIFLTGGLNVFREEVIYLFGKGELHPKSPSRLTRS